MREKEREREWGSGRMKEIRVVTLAVGYIREK